MSVNLKRERPAPPPLESPDPDIYCSLCGAGVVLAGEFFQCHHCDASWPWDRAFGAEGHWCDPDAKRCVSTYTSGGWTAWCVLHRGHSLAHRADTPAGYRWRWLS